VITDFYRDFDNRNVLEFPDIWNRNFPYLTHLGISDYIQLIHRGQSCDRWNQERS